MSPEQRAERAVSALAEGGAALVDFEWAERIIARAIRAAENAALERAARGLENVGREDGWTGGLPETYIRSLKSRAPKRRTSR